MRIIAACALVSLTLATSAAARAIRVQWVEAVNNNVQCKTYHNGWLATTTGPCSDFKRPDTIAVGQAFSADDVSHVIYVIVATQAEEDYTDSNLSIKRGQWYCAAAESSADLDTDSKADRRTWLFIPNCIPVQ